MKTGSLGRASLSISVVFVLSIAAPVYGFVPSTRANFVESSTSLGMGLFDGIKNAFANEEFAAPPEGLKASARHILVKTLEEADDVMKKLEDGSTFASLASEFSTCPSSARGGSLGSFSPGTMVAEFDEVIFSPETNIGEVAGPVQTQFGYHIIVVDKRTGV